MINFTSQNTILIIILIITIILVIFYWKFIKVEKFTVDKHPDLGLTVLYAHIYSFKSLRDQMDKLTYLIGTGIRENLMDKTDYINQIQDIIRNINLTYINLNRIFNTLQITPKQVEQVMSDYNRYEEIFNLVSDRIQFKNLPENQKKITPWMK